LAIPEVDDTMNRRQFLKRSGAAGAALMLPTALGASRARAQGATRLAGASYTPKFTQQLRRPPRIDMNGLGNLASIDIEQFEQQVLVGYPKTKLYGYGSSLGRPSWPGPTFEAMSNRRARVLWRNKIKTTGDWPNCHLLPVDESLHMAMVESPDMLKGIPTVTHLHGSHVEAASDGYPEAWFTRDMDQRGPAWEKLVYNYDNTQQSGTLWYHDHALGLTRLNVYAGLAGMYLLRDENERSLVRHHVLPDDDYEVELVLQDRAFNDDGSLFLPLRPTATIPNGIDLSIFLDFLCVNGTPWPVMDVEPRKYRFRIVNGSDSRFFQLKLDNSDAEIIQVGTELGLRRKALQIDRILMGPAERYDIVIDFSGLAGKEIMLQNLVPDGPFRGFASGPGGPGPGRTVTNNPHDFPFVFGAPFPSAATASVMKFRVSKRKSGKPDASVTDGMIIGPRPAELTATSTRSLMTFNGSNDGLGRSAEMLGTLQDGTFSWHDPVTETPKLGDTEMWEFYNTGPVAHPIHVHLVDFQVVDRQPFTFTVEPKTMTAHDGSTAIGARITDFSLVGSPRDPEPYEQGPKDTVVCYPGEVTRVVAKFDRPGEYVWHCHIIHHEDHDMMRPFIVGSGDPDDHAVMASNKRRQLYCDLKQT
jgi:spore coat protein A, manganese oxidase